MYSTALRSYPLGTYHFDLGAQSDIINDAVTINGRILPSRPTSISMMECYAKQHNDMRCTRKIVVARKERKKGRKKKKSSPYLGQDKYAFKL